MPDIRWDWIERNRDQIVSLTIEHLVLVAISMLIAIAIAIPVAVLVRHGGIWNAVATYTSGVLYTIPSLALFAFLVPFTGIGTTPVVIGLVAYALLILISNAVVGFQSVPPAVMEAAEGMGLSSRQTLMRVEFPLALPAIMAGIRLATVSTVGIATIGAFVGGGGLGELIYQQGIQRGLFVTPIVVGAVVATAMALVLDALLIGIESALKPWDSPVRGRLARLGARAVFWQRRDSLGGTAG
jgi:osmoprotectant transport system permease protein